MSAVVIKTRVQAENIDALNRKAVYASADTLHAVQTCSRFGHGPQKTSALTREIFSLHILQ